MAPELKDSLQKIIQNFREKDFEKAASSINQLLSKDIKNSNPILELGISFAKVNQFQEAQIVLTCLKHYKKNDLLVLYNLGLICSAIGNHHMAIENYNEILTIHPEDVETLVNKGSAYIDLQNYDLAIPSLQSAIKLQPNIPEAWSNLGKAYNGLNLCQESLDAYDKAISLRPIFYEAWSNKSRPLCKLRRFVEASDACDQALLLHPEYVEGLSNKGNALYELERFEDAIDFFDEALRLRPSYAEAFLNKAHALFQLGRYVEAISSYEEAFLLKPDIDWLLGCLIFAKMKICDWTEIDGYIEKIIDKLMVGDKVIDPFPLLALVDDASLHKKASEIYINWKYPPNNSLGAIRKKPSGEKIRIAYFSADFHNHATSFLMAKIFELHDKNLFELVGFSFGPIIHDDMYERNKKSFDQFYEVREKSDLEIASLSRDLNIDIAIDLKGFTEDSRTGIFSNRAAPIQVNYLGYPGTMGAPYIDYVISDETIIPTEYQQFYTEKIAYVANSYQANDRNRFISDRQFSRDELGLPEKGFVFCCFNNNYKILPRTFDGWMRILNAVPGSILWLFEDNQHASSNLRLGAEKRGVDPNRLVFAQKIPLPDHLARHRLADLFLDTSPYNAHTTASDSLWAGLPVLSLISQSFAGRVAASLLNAIGIPELIVTSQEDYESLAIQLATNPKMLFCLKEKLNANRLKAPLFDSKLFTHNLEAVYIEMHQTFRTDLSPRHIVLN